MKSLAERIAAMDALLAPYAVPHEGQKGRRREEESDGVRTPFQRDRARVIHSQAFRRLAGKTQVFVVGQGDHYRTRLTHTMEVAQISRDLARALGLNEDLAECIGLAHDLGHPPFGHAGEDALDAWMRTHGQSFEHNLQSYRIVTMLEFRAEGQTGLNLSREVEEGLLKHGGRTIEGTETTLTLEAHLANACDEIAYVAHDCDDGLRALCFSYEDLKTIPLAKDAAVEAEKRGTRIRSVLIDLLARDLLQTAEQLQDGKPVIGLSPSMRSALQPLRAFLWERMYMHPQVVARAEEGQRAIRSVCEVLAASPTEPVLAIQARTQSTLIEAVKDYVAGMTDSFALKTAEERVLR